MPPSDGSPIGGPHEVWLLPRASSRVGYTRSAHFLQHQGVPRMVRQKPACVSWVSACAPFGMNDRASFSPLQAQQVAEAFNSAGVDYLFIGKSDAILLGYPGTTQDVDVFPAKSAENGHRMVRALLELGFPLDDTTQAEIVRGKVFVQLKNGPFD